MSTDQEIIERLRGALRQIQGLGDLADTEYGQQPTAIRMAEIAKETLAATSDELKICTA